MSAEDIYKEELNPLSTTQMSKLHGSRGNASTGKTMLIPNYLIFSNGVVIEDTLPPNAQSATVEQIESFGDT